MCEKFKNSNRCNKNQQMKQNSKWFSKIIPRIYPQWHIASVLVPSTISQRGPLMSTFTASCKISHQTYYINRITKKICKFLYWQIIRFFQSLAIFSWILCSSSIPIFAILIIQYLIFIHNGLPAVLYPTPKWPHEYKIYQKTSMCFYRLLFTLNI